MASFFQPPSGGDPVLDECDTSNFLVYCNRFLSPDEIRQNWYQHLVLGVALAALFIPLLFWIPRNSLRHIRKLRSALSTHKESPGSSYSKSVLSNGSLVEVGVNGAAGESKMSLSLHVPGLRSTKSMSYIALSGNIGPLPEVAKDRGLTIVQWTGSAASCDLNRSRTLTDRSEDNVRPRKSMVPAVRIFCVDLASIVPDGLTHTSSSISAVASRLCQIYIEAGRGPCLALRPSPRDDPAAVGELIQERLLHYDVRILLVLHHDLPMISQYSFRAVVGVILENACIFPGGERRDYFRSAPFRSLAARCAAERADRPDLFFALLDLWVQPPSAAVVKRAEKVAAHFGAVLEHGPDSPQGGAKPTPHASMTLGAFDYLQRFEATDLHRKWSDGESTPWVPGGSSIPDDATTLQVTDLEKALPGIRSMLQPVTALGRKLTVRNVTANRLQLDDLVPPPYSEKAPARADVWEFSNDNQPLSDQGCYPLTAQPTRAHYTAVVQTQSRLLKLGLLEAVKGEANQRLRDTYLKLHRRLLTQYPTGHVSASALGELIKGLKEGRVCIHKGLDTGMSTHERDDHFWGVCEPHDDPLFGAESVDIFLSLKAPVECDASTVLHTWLAHHCISRVDRYLIELELERHISPAADADAKLPRGIATALEDATNSELLFLCQQMRAASPERQGPFQEEIVAKCEHILLDQASINAWKRVHSHDHLAGTIDTSTLFSRRLDFFQSRGASELPKLENLLRLHSSMTQVVHDALLYGDRDTIGLIVDTLRRAFSPPSRAQKTYSVDINADLVALSFFVVLRREAFEDVYLEATDRCPFFLSQPDQAAVFSELWVLGSQCEIYFGIRPRELGRIIFDRYQAYLGENPPPVDGAREKGELMTMYSDPSEDNGPGDEADEDEGAEEPVGKKGLEPLRASPVLGRETIRVWKQRALDFGAMSIFCVPAILDVGLLTLLGRGLFVTAFMAPDHILAAGYAVLTALLISAGVTGWVASTGQYYMPHYAYDNMVFFHVQRLSGGFVLTLAVAVIGLVPFTVTYSIYTGLVFAAYVVAVSMYLIILGIMATMHQPGSPLTSGRVVLWRTIPMLLISPLVSSFVRGYDLQIYLPVSLGFLFVILYQYRRLCEEWTTWLSKIPSFTEKDVIEWYSSKEFSRSDSSLSRSITPVPAIKDGEIIARSQTPNPTPAVTPDSQLRKEVQARLRARLLGGSQSDPLVVRVSKGMPYIDWLFAREFAHSAPPPQFTAAWFNALTQAVEKQQQMRRGLKEHSPFMQFRIARYDLFLNVSLFLIALMDRWVALVMQGQDYKVTMYVDFRARYGLCLCILYFCLSVMCLDATLQNFWGERFKLSDEKLTDLEHAKEISLDWERRRKKNYITALARLFEKMLAVLGLTTLLLWVTVSNHETMILYACYISGYTSVVVMQFNRCFTHSVSKHTMAIYSSAVFGFVTGCLLHLLPWTTTLLYSDVIALNAAAIAATISTTIHVWRGFRPALCRKSSDDKNSSGSTSSAAPPQTKKKIYRQRLICASGRQVPENALISPTSGWSQVRAKSTAVGETTPVNTEIGGILSTATAAADQQPGLASGKATVEVARQAWEMWKGRRISLSFLDKTKMANLGFEDCCSVGYQNKKGVLYIVVGAFGETEIRNSSWTQIRSRIAVEAILHHVALLRGDTSQAALQAESLLTAGEDQMIPKRMDLELSTAPPKVLRNVYLKTNSELVKHLALGVDVDAQWEEIGDSLRRAIYCRIMGTPFQSVGLRKSFAEKVSVDAEASNFHLILCLQLGEAAVALLSRGNAMSNVNRGGDGGGLCEAPELKVLPIRTGNDGKSLASRLIHWAKHRTLGVVRWIAILSSGGSGLEREANYQLGGFRAPVWCVVTTWKLMRLCRNAFIWVILVYYSPSLQAVYRFASKGALRIVKKDTVMVELSRKKVTGFASQEAEGAMGLDVYEGALSARPGTTGVQPTVRALYDANFRLQSRKEKMKTGVTVVSTYSYASGSSSRWPLRKESADEDQQWKFSGCYDSHGRISKGVITFQERYSFNFRYFYKSTPKGSTDIIKAEYNEVGPGDKDGISIFWGQPTRASPKDKDYYNWVPSARVGKIVRRVADRSYVTNVEYLHRRDPIYTTSIESDFDSRRQSKTVVATPPHICPRAIEAELLKKPMNHAFESDDLLIYHGRHQVGRMLKAARKSGQASKGRKLLPRMDMLSWLPAQGPRVYKRLPTWSLRTELWNHWLQAKSQQGRALSAVMACHLDEMILREEPLLRRYWRYRDQGLLSQARAVLDKDIDQISSAIEIESAVSEVCLLPIRPADLYAMGLNKDAAQVTNRPQDCYLDNNERISVIVTDIGCWPEAPGGVSNCRRDLVNGHSTIRNHVVAEVASDFGIPRFQVEKNVQSIKLVPLWGLDMKTADHGIIDNLLQSQVDAKIEDTDLKRDVEGVFVPLLKMFVKGARAKNFTRDDLIDYSNAILSISKYFEMKDYSRTWDSDAVEKAWIESWTKHGSDDEMINPTFAIERPSLRDLQDALNIYKAYFFIFSIQVPDDCPQVFQSTHHGLGSLLGMILKYRRGTNVSLWDHAILWRESCLNISPAQSTLSIPIQTMLLAGIRLATQLTYFHADVVMPCTSVFNPIWEADIGTVDGKLGSRKQFSRKIDAVVNGISNMDSFTPIPADSVQTTRPTVVMLSNVQFIKGIKPAIEAASLIVNEYGFRDYQLFVYGAKDRQPSYCAEMTRLITERGLTDNVFLKGFGKPAEALKDAWIFMNSSLSEGLPLAIGEAALAGVPIVATEVGATALVLTDQQSGERYGEVVPPNNASALARAQISLMAMVGPWAKFTNVTDDDPSSRRASRIPPGPTLPEELGPGQVEWIARRMAEKAGDRRRLGMKSREVVLNSFHGERYLREHEQMFWVQSCLARMRADPHLASGTRYRFGGKKPLVFEEDGAVGLERRMEAQLVGNRNSVLTVGSRVVGMNGGGGLTARWARWRYRKGEKLEV